MPIQTDQDMSMLRGVCNRYAIPYPEGVTDASEALAATRELLDKVRTAPSPDPTSVTAANAEALLEAMSTPVSREQRVDAAQRLVSAAESRLRGAWEAGLHLILRALPEHFNAEAATFTAALAALGGQVDPGSAVIAMKAKEHNAMNGAARAMKQIVTLYQAVHPRRSTGNSLLDGLDPFVRVVDRNTIASIPAHVGNATWEPTWIAALLAMPGADIEWKVGPPQQYVDLPRDASQSAARR